MKCMHCTNKLLYTVHRLRGQHNSIKCTSYDHGVKLYTEAFRVACTHVFLTSLKSNNYMLMKCQHSLYQCYQLVGTQERSIAFALKKTPPTTRPKVRKELKLHTMLRASFMCLPLDTTAW